MAIGDWLPLASTVGGTAVGLAGIWATLKASKRQSESSLLAVQQQAEFQASIAAHERQQERREATYADLAQWVEDCAEIEHEVKKIDTFSAIRIGMLIERVRALTIARPSARQSLMWSDAVVELEEKFHGEIRLLDALMIELQDIAADYPAHESHQLLGTVLDNATAAGKDLIGAMRQELNSHSVLPLRGPETRTESDML